MAGEEQKVTEAFGSFQAVATCTFFTAGGTAAHAADARLVTACKQPEETLAA